MWSARRSSSTPRPTISPPSRPATPAGGWPAASSRSPRSSGRSEGPDPIGRAAPYYLATGAGADLVAVGEVCRHRRGIDRHRPGSRRIAARDVAQRHHPVTVELLGLRPGLLADAGARDPRRIIIVVGMDPAESPGDPRLIGRLVVGRPLQQ